MYSNRTKELYWWRWRWRWRRRRQSNTKSSKAPRLERADGDQAYIGTDPSRFETSQSHGPGQHQRTSCSPRTVGQESGASIRKRACVLIHTLRAPPIREREGGAYSITMRAAAQAKGRNSDAALATAHSTLLSICHARANAWARIRTHVHTHERRRTPSTNKGPLLTFGCCVTWPRTAAILIDKSTRSPSSSKGHVTACCGRCGEVRQQERHTRRNTECKHGSVSWRRLVQQITRFSRLRFGSSMR